MTTSKDIVMHYEHLSLARAPKANPHSLAELQSHATYTITPIDHDYPGKTPAMWNAAYAAFGIDAQMAMMVGDPIHTEEILRELALDPQYQGGGSGSGFKELVAQKLMHTTPVAQAIGAVNIIKRQSDGSLIGDTTDGEGFAESLAEAFARQGCALDGSLVLMLGAGGTGRAISFALAQRGARLVILNRTEARAQELAQSVNAFMGKEVAQAVGRDRITEVIPHAHALVSVIDDAASPLDAYSTIGTMDLSVTDESIGVNEVTSKELLAHASPTLIVSDVRLRNNETPTLRIARELGHPVLDGVPMVINQGVQAFWWLHGEQLAAHGITRADVASIMSEAAK